MQYCSGGGTKSEMWIGSSPMGLGRRKITLTDAGVLPATARIHSNVSEPGIGKICALFSRQQAQQDSH